MKVMLYDLNTALLLTRGQEKYKQGVNSLVPPSSFFTNESLLENDCNPREEFYRSLAQF